MFFFPRRKDCSPSRPSRLLRPGLERLADRLNPVVIANPDTYTGAAGQVLTVNAAAGVLNNDFDNQDAGAVLQATLIQGAQFTGSGKSLPPGSLTLFQNGQTVDAINPLSPGETSQMTLFLSPGTYSMVSTVLSDQSLGAYGTLKVTK